MDFEPTEPEVVHPIPEQLKSRASPPLVQELACRYTLYVNSYVRTAQVWSIVK